MPPAPRPDFLVSVPLNPVNMFQDYCNFYGLEIDKEHQPAPDANKQPIIWLRPKGG
jgi:hypothetical protein